VYDNAASKAEKFCGVEYCFNAQYFSWLALLNCVEIRFCNVTYNILLLLSAVGAGDTAAYPSKILLGIID